MKFVRVSKAEHADFGFAPEKPFAFARDWGFIPITSGEILKLLPWCVLAFRSTRNGLELGVVSSGVADENWLVNPVNGRFLWPHVPAFLRRYPYDLQRDEMGKEFLVVWERETDFRRGAGRAVVSSSGLTDYGVKQMNFIRLLNGGFARDQKALSVLRGVNVFTPLSLGSIQRDDLWGVDESKWERLTPFELKKLQEANALDLLTYQRLSRQNMANLQRIHERYSQLSAGGEDHLDVSDWFEDGQEDSII